MDTVLDALQEELRASEAELVAVERQMDPLRARHDELEAMVRALKFTIERRAARQVVAASAPNPTWARLSLRAAIERLLTERGPLTVREIAEALTENGRPSDAKKSISATLSHLKAAGKASSADGRWQLHPNGNGSLPPAFDQFRARSHEHVSSG
jgi:hypothetical protein